MLKVKYCFQIILLIIASIVIGIIVVEAGLRIAGVSYIQAYTYDMNRGSALRPHAKGWWSREGRSYIKINSDGLRDREYALGKNEDTFRIAVLGDSYAEALQVESEKTFWSVLEKELNLCTLFEGKNIEVINFGVAGYGTAQELLTLQYHARKYDPDLVVLAVMTGNDIRNNSKILEPDKVRPFFVYRDGKLELDRSFQDLPQYKKGQSWFKSTLRELSTYSRIVQLLYEVKQKGALNFLSINRNASQKEKGQNRIESALAARRVRDFPEHKQSTWERGLDVQVYHKSSGPDWEDAWKITEDLIVIMRDEVEKMGAGFLVLTLSNGIQVHPDPAVRAKFMVSQGIDSLFYPDERIRAVCKASGISVLNLAKSFRDYAEKNEVCLHGFENAEMCGGHWNEKGHFLAGRMLFDEICDLGNEYTQ